MTKKQPVKKIVKVKKISTVPCTPAAATGDMRQGKDSSYEVVITTAPSPCETMPRVENKPYTIAEASEDGRRIGYAEGFSDGEYKGEHRGAWIGVIFGVIGIMVLEFVAVFVRGIFLG